MAGQSHTCGSLGAQPEQAPTLRAAASGTNQAPALCFPYSSGGNGVGYGFGEELSPTMLAKNCGEPAVCVQGTIANGKRMGQNGLGADDSGNSYTLDTMDVHAVCFAQNQQWEIRLNGGDGQIAPCVPASRTAKQIEIICQANLADDDPAPWFEGERRPDFKYHLRRLTPLECERLQGFPSGWTDIEYKGKPAADAPRYKALGNSMAVPVMRWIGERIQMIEEEA